MTFLANFAGPLLLFFFYSPSSQSFWQKKNITFFLQLIHHTEFVMCYLQVLHNVWEDFVRLHYPNSDHISKHRDKQNFWKNKEKEEEECKICE